MKFDYVLHACNSKLYLPDASHVLNMLGNWIGGTLYRRVGIDRAVRVKEAGNAEIYRIEVLVRYGSDGQRCVIPVVVPVGLEYVSVTLRNAIREDMKGNGRVNVGIFRVRGTEIQRVGLERACGGDVQSS